MDSYSIGIDTGGTCTDAVLISNSTLQVAHWIKEPTTHHDLGIGVGRALERLLADSSVPPEAVSRLSVSTTLATNAVVEGRGARVGLLVFGHVRHFKLPVTASVFMKGGHKITGEEDEPLDLEGLVDSVRAIRGEVDSYAVCSAMSIKNPAHELVAEEAIAILDPKPVFCSHQVSGSPGMHARAATACLHARLMPLMVGFLSSVQISMLRTGLSCPVTIICGSGRGASLDEAVRRAAITVASGPAATARFGCTAGEQTALVVDVGGTTTDVCMIRDGHPVLSNEGCRIGQWQTHIEAIDMYTAAGGGDSHVICAADDGQDGSLRLAPVRVQPLCMTAGLPDPDDWLGCGLRNSLIMPVEGLDEAAASHDDILNCLLQHGPLSPQSLALKTGAAGMLLEKWLERLTYRQQIRVIGFTPTDALHVLGRLTIGDRSMAERGAKALAEVLGTDVERLCLRVVAETEQVIETIILDYLARKVWPASETAPFLSSKDNPLFSLSVAVKIPIIGIGAASRCFLPAVAERLRTTVSFPDYYEVGNAVGAALIGREEFPADAAHWQAISERE